MSSAQPETSATPRTAGPTPRRRFSATDLALVASFAALIAALGVPGTINLAGNAVPITLQTLGVMLAGAVLGWRRGMAAVAVLLVLVAAGLPLLAGGRGSIAVFAGPSAGYLLGWLLGAAAIGWMVQSRLPRVSLVWTALACVVGGILVVYAFGIPVQAARTGLGLDKAALMSLGYLPGDLIKVAIATVVSGAAHRANPELTPALRR